MSSTHLDLQPARQSVFKQRSLRHEVRAEVLGTAIMIITGNGVVASAALSSGDDFAKQLFVNTTWAMAVCFGVLTSFDVSGAHLNPSVTVHAIVFGGLPFSKGMHFILAQLLGAFIGAIVVTFNFIVLRGQKHLSNVYCTRAADNISTTNAFLNEFIATAVLIAGIQSVVSHAPKPSKYHVAAFVGALVFMIGNVFGPLTGYALNPARDFGPRMCWLLFAIIYGRSSPTCLGSECLWSEVMGSGYFLIPLVAPVLGGLVGGCIYKRTIFTEIADAQLDSANFQDEHFLPATAAAVGICEA